MPPKTRFDAVIYGHFHTGFIEKSGDAVFVNCGSVALPKNGTPNSYVILEQGKISLKTIDGNVIDEIDL